MRRESRERIRHGWFILRQAQGERDVLGVLVWPAGLGFAVGWGVRGYRGRGLGNSSAVPLEVVPATGPIESGEDFRFLAALGMTGGARNDRWRLECEVTLGYASAARPFDRLRACPILDTGVNGSCEGLVGGAGEVRFLPFCAALEFAALAAVEVLGARCWTLTPALSQNGRGGRRTRCRVCRRVIGRFGVCT